MPKIIHASKGGIALCGSFDDTAVELSQIMDPATTKFFTCGACWKVLANNVEPMGGSLYLPKAHGAGAK